MTSRVPPETRSQIIHQWLGGDSRNKISKDVGLATGTISSIVEEFKSELGVPTAESLRVFARELKKLGISAPLSAQGARILNVMQRLSVDDETLSNLLSKRSTTSVSLLD